MRSLQEMYKWAHDREVFLLIRIIQLWNHSTAIECASYLGARFMNKKPKRNIFV
jgi:hypothetical protein